MQAGDYKITVHVIEAKDLDARDISGLADPLVVIKAFGQTHKTSVKTQRLAAYWDEYFTFHVRAAALSLGQASSLVKSYVRAENVTVQIQTATFTHSPVQAERTKPQLSASQIEFEVMDKDLLSCQPIGTFVIDLMTVYYQPCHRFRQQWLALSAPPHDKRSRALAKPYKGGCTGYLLVSMSVLGPNDALIAEEEHYGDEESGGKDSIMLPPSLKEQTVFARIAVLAARQLPSAQSWYVEVCFENCVASTNQKSLKSTDPNFMEELWMPLHVPSFGASLQIMLKEKSRPNTPLLTLKLGVKELLQDCQDHEQMLRWFHIYGFGELVQKERFLVSGIKKSKLALFEEEFKSSWHGKLLLGFRIETPDKNRKYTKDKLTLQDKIYHLPLRGKEKFEEMWKPQEDLWELRAVVLSGSGEPKRMSRMHVEITVGEYAFESRCPIVRSGQASFLGPPINEVGQDVLNRLRWVDIGSAKPISFVELKNEKLASALVEKQTFNEEEWESFGVDQLLSHHVVRSGEVYYQPSGIPTAPGVMRPKNRRPEFSHARHHMPDVIVYLCDGPKRLYFKRIRYPADRVDPETQPILNINNQWFVLLPIEPKDKIRVSSVDEALPALLISIKLQLVKGQSTVSVTKLPIEEGARDVAALRANSAMARVRADKASQRPALSAEERVENLEQRLTSKMPRRSTLCAFELRLHVYMGRDLVRLRPK